MVHLQWLSNCQKIDFISFPKLIFFSFRVNWCGVLVKRTQYEYNSRTTWFCFMHIQDIHNCVAWVILMVKVILFDIWIRINLLQLTVYCYFLYTLLLHSLFLMWQIHFQSFRQVLEVKHNNGFISECSTGRQWCWRQWNDQLSGQWYGINNCYGWPKAELEPGHQLDPENFGPPSPALPDCHLLQCCFPASSSPTPVPSCNPICCCLLFHLLLAFPRNWFLLVQFCSNSLVIELDNMVKLAEKCNIHVPMEVLKWVFPWLPLLHLQLIIMIWLKLFFNFLLLRLHLFC